MIKQLTSRRNKEMGIDTKADKSKTDSQQFLNIRWMINQTNIHHIELTMKEHFRASQNNTV